MWKKVHKLISPSLDESAKILKASNVESLLKCSIPLVLLVTLYGVNMIRLNGPHMLPVNDTFLIIYEQKLSYNQGNSAHEDYT
ncbi:hypothetical protein ACMD2_09977 [Ananas comosus]|uniref:Uncharacterized protein n=1 Tax=Ananas comosus TaxID=4615 RepID=A0A199W910_ANACO|nr:hypothetical protein ACMD2_09977 [Ananas comosus]